jgi:hypothetical protein
MVSIWYYPREIAIAENCGSAQREVIYVSFALDGLTRKHDE